MNLSIKYGTENIDWAALCEIFRLAPLGTREPEKLKIAAENSHTVCCSVCGESYITAETLHEIERIKLHRQSFAVNRNVPVADFA